MGIEPTPRAAEVRGNGFEDRESHQAPSASAEESSTGRTSAPRNRPPAAGIAETLAGSVPLRVAILALLLAAAYAGSLRAGVAWDDIYLISGNPAIRTLARPWRFFTDQWTMATPGGAMLSQYRPLRTLAFALQFAVFGGSAWGFHLVSILLQAVAAWLVGVLAQDLFGRGGWIASAIWLVHPAISENVVALSAQANLICLVLTLAAVHAHLRWLDTGARTWRAGSIAAFVLATLTYEFGAVLPVLLPVVEALRDDRVSFSFKRAIRRHLPFWIALGALLALRAAVTLPVPRTPWWEGSWTNALLTQLRVWVEGWRLTILPLTQRVRYLPPDIPAFATTWVAVALHIGLAVLVIRAMLTGKGRVAAACVVWWYVAQAPTSNIIVSIPGYMFAPRYLFMALALPIAASGGWLDPHLDRRAVLVAVAAGAIVAVSLDRRQVEAWQSPLSINREIIAQDSGDGGAHRLLGWGLLLSGDLDGAKRELELSRDLAPSWPPTHSLLGEVLARQGDLRAAHTEYKTVITLDPTYIEPRLRLAEIAILAGQPRAGRDWLATVPPFDNFGPFARARVELTLARLEFLVGDRSRVDARIQRALSEWTGTSDVLFESGVLLSYCGQRERGRALLAKAATQAGRDYYDMVGDFAWVDLARLPPLLPLTPPGRFDSFSIPVVGP